MPKHVKVRNFRKTRRAIRESNGTTVRKQIRKTEVHYIRGENDPTGDEYIKSLDSKYFTKTQDTHSNTPYDSIDWKSVLKG